MIISAELATLPRSFQTPRRDAIERRHDWLRQQLRSANLDAVCLFDAGNLAWLADGWDCPVVPTFADGPAVLVTSDARTLVCRPALMEWLLHEQLDGMGFMCKEVFGPTSVLQRLHELRGLDRWGSDVLAAGLEDDPAPLAQQRCRLDEATIERLGRHTCRLVNVLETAVRKLPRRCSERELAGWITQQLTALGQTPVEVLISADGRGLARQRPWPSNAGIEHFGSVQVRSLRRGLRLTASRSFAFGSIPEEFRQQQRAAQSAAAVVEFGSVAGRPVNKLLKRWRQSLAQMGVHPGPNAEPAGRLAGFGASGPDLGVFPDATLAPGQVIEWTTKVGDAIAADCVIVGADAGRAASGLRRWPYFNVDIDGCSRPRPAILVR